MVFTRSTSRRAPATWRYVATAIVATLVLCTACSRGDDDVATGTSSTTTEGTGDTQGPGEEAGPGDFGTLKDVCGPAEGGGENGDSAQGVTADSIKVGPSPILASWGDQDSTRSCSTPPTSSWTGATRPAASTDARSSSPSATPSSPSTSSGSPSRAPRTSPSSVAARSSTTPVSRSASTCLLPSIPAYVVSSQARGADLQVQPLPNALDTLERRGDGLRGREVPREHRPRRLHHRQFAIKNNTGSRDRALALAVAQQEMERYRQMKFLDAGLTAHAATSKTVTNGDDRTYTVVTTITDTTTSLKTIKIQVTPLLNKDEWARGTVEISVQRAAFALGPYAGS